MDRMVCLLISSHANTTLPLDEYKSYRVSSAGHCGYCRLNYNSPMPALALTLILLSSLCHAVWNLLLKRSGNQEVFVWMLLVVGSVVLLPLGVILFWLYPTSWPGYWLVLASAGTHAFYFILLGRAYSKGDLSLVYPIARGVGPMLVPVLAVLILGESVSLPAVFGIALIVAGIFLVSWWGRFRQILTEPTFLLRDGGVRYAVLTGLTITLYALVDKRGVEYTQPFLYMYLLTVGSAIGIAPYILFKCGLADVRREWKKNSWSILAASLLVFLAYGMVLTAFTLSQVSYVAPAREVGIVVGVFMGVFFLKEGFGRGRLLGSSFIVLGLALIALSP